MEFTKLPANAWEQIQINAGIMVKSFDPETREIDGALAATESGFEFNPNPEYEDFGEDLDNVPPNTWQLKRLKGCDPTISATFKTMTGTLAAMLAGAADLAGEGRIVPRSALKEADFQDVWVVGDYSKHNNGRQAGFIAVRLKRALNTAGFQWKTQKDGKGSFAVEFHGHYDLNDLDEVPFEIYVVSGGE